MSTTGVSAPGDNRAIKAFKKGVLYHGEDCNRGPENDPPILEPAFLAGLPRARGARGTEPHTHGIWSTFFLLVVT